MVFQMLIYVRFCFRLTDLRTIKLFKKQFKQFNLPGISLPGLLPACRSFL